MGLGSGRERESELVNNSECALSLLSSNPWKWNMSTSPDLPARCSAALRELIAENRASRHHNQMNDPIRAGPSPQGGGAHVTLNLMQAPNSAAFGLLSMHHHHNSNSNSKDDAQHCSDLWNLPLGY